MTLRIGGSSREAIGSTSLLAYEILRGWVDSAQRVVAVVPKDPVYGGGIANQFRGKLLDTP